MSVYLNSLNEYVNRQTLLLNYKLLRFAVKSNTFSRACSAMFVGADKASQLQMSQATPPHPPNTQVVQCTFAYLMYFCAKVAEHWAVLLLGRRNLATFLWTCRRTRCERHLWVHMQGNVLRVSDQQVGDHRDICVPVIVSTHLPFLLTSHCLHLLLLLRCCFCYPLTQQLALTISTKHAQKKKEQHLSGLLFVANSSS